MKEKDKSCLKVAVPLSLRETFTYRVPEHLADRVEVGLRVQVPFRDQKLTGYILEKGSDDHEGGLKEILEILDEKPLFHESLVPFFRWVADYYLYPIGRLIQAALPGGINVSHFKTGYLTEKGTRVFDLLPPPVRRKETSDLDQG